MIDKASQVAGRVTDPERARCERAAGQIALAEEWRHRAELLELYARVCRRDGDLPEAQDAEQAASDYRIAADELEAGAEVAP